MFIHLHCHSHYSFLRAVPSPEEILTAATEQKMPAVALTDTNGLYAAVPFYQAARAAGVKPIIGTVLDVEDPSRRGIPQLRDRAPTEEGQIAAQNALLLLAKNHTGYSNLCRLVTERHLKEAPVTLEALDEHRAGLIALYPPGRRGAACCAPEGDGRNRSAGTGRGGTGRGAASSAPTDETTIAQLKEIFGEALHLEACHFSGGGNLREAVRLAKQFGVPMVATNRVHFIKPEDHLHHRVLNAIRTGSLVTRIAPPEIVSPEAYFKSGSEMRWAFADYPEALRATLDIAEQCDLHLDLGHLVFPEFPVPEGESPFSYLWKLCFEGARQRYKPLRPEVLARLTHELEIINRLNLAPFFLLVWDIAEEARRRGIPAVARGSAASSIVTYCLGISRACPLRWNLYFERFLNEERGDCPDIDLDICGARRDELLDYVYKRWGKEHVAMISSFVTMQARMAVREVAKVFGVAPGEVNHFTRRLPHRPVREIREAIRTLPECRDLPVAEDPWRTVLEVAERLDNFPRHLGIHPCGTVISARPLTELVPLEIATKGIVVTQYDMNPIEALGLIKMDLLGQRGLTAVSLALENIKRSAEESGTDATVDFDAIPEDDAATKALASSGRTMGIFQIESPGMRNLLRALKAETLEAVCLALALIRPGASDYGSKETFLRRLRKQEPVRYPHPRLEPILKESLGVCVYQEQVMQIAQAAGGLTLAEADLVRRAKAKFKDARERERLHGKFLKAAAHLGLAGAELDQTWVMVEKFAGYGFCKAHAATYAEISWRIAYLKAHYPAEYLAAMCSAGAGFYHVSAYVEEAKRTSVDGRGGIEVRLPSVNHSRLEYSTESTITTPASSSSCSGGFTPPSFSSWRDKPAATEGAASSASTRAIRVGLMQVRGLGAETIRAILKTREEQGPFRSLEDFLARVPIERDEIEALIKCGAFDDVYRGDAPAVGGRPALLWRLNMIGRARGVVAPGFSPALSLFADAAAPPPDLVQQSAIPLADYTIEQRLRHEQEILEVCISGHPLDLVTRNGETWSNELPRFYRGGRSGRIGADSITLLGWLITFRHVGTKDYRNMMFCTFEDQRGMFEAVLFPEAYERYGALVFETRTMRVTGRVEQDGQINCEKLEPVRG